MVPILSWLGTGEILIATFDEVLKGQLTGPMKRQYWARRVDNGRYFSKE